MNKISLAFAFGSLLFSCGAQSSTSSDSQLLHLYEEIRYDTFLYCAANRLWYAPTEEDYEWFPKANHLAECHGYYVYYLNLNSGCRLGWFDIYAEYDKPVDYGDGLVVELVYGTSYPNYFAWKDHRVYVLEQAYSLELLNRSDMEKVSSAAHRINVESGLEPCII